jgi:hypothetical protein
MPFKSVTRSIKSLNLGICNCFLLHGTFGYAIVDTGLAKHGDTILKAIAVKVWLPNKSSTWLNSNKGTKCDVEIRVARTFAGGRVCSL